jgi:hypothetical protein
MPAKLRAAGPVVEVRFPIIGRTWVTTTSDLASHVLKDSETFTMRKNGKVAGLRWWMPGWIRALAVSMLTMDEPDHTRLRNIVDEAFRRRAILEMEPRIFRLPMSLRLSCSLTEYLVERSARTPLHKKLDDSGLLGRENVPVRVGSAHGSLAGATVRPRDDLLDLLRGDRGRAAPFAPAPARRRQPRRDPLLDQAGAALHLDRHPGAGRLDGCRRPEVEARRRAARLGQEGLRDRRENKGERLGFVTRTIRRSRAAVISYDRSLMLLKAFILLVVASFGVTLFIRSPQAKRVGWIVTGSLVLLGLLAVQLLRTLDTMLR